MDSESFELEFDLGRLCPECNKPCKKDGWCKGCNGKRLQQDFSNWTSGNELIDGFIQESQSNAYENDLVLERIPYNRFENIEYFGKRKFNAIYKAIWLNGLIKRWSNDERKWIRCNKGLSSNVTLIIILLRDYLISRLFKYMDLLKIIIL